MSKTTIEDVLVDCTGIEAYRTNKGIKNAMRKWASLSTPCEELKARIEKDSDSLNAVSIEYNKRLMENEELKKELADCIKEKWEMADDAVKTIDEKEKRISELEGRSRGLQFACEKWQILFDTEVEIKTKLQQRISELEAGLRWLVNLKTKKDIDGKDEIYLQEQPKAWERAKELLNKDRDAQASVATDDDSKTDDDKQNNL